MIASDFASRTTSPREILHKILIITEILDEAIRWHGGEAQAAQQAYAGMSAGERNAIIAFLKSL